MDAYDTQRLLLLFSCSVVSDSFVTPRGFPDSSAGKESACNAGDLGLIPGLGRSSGEGTGYSLQYSGLENSMDCIVHRVAKSWTLLSDFHFHFKDYSPQAPLSMGFPRQEHWSGLPFPSRGDPPDSGIEPRSPALAGRFLTTEPPGRPAQRLSDSPRALMLRLRLNQSSSALPLLLTSLGGRLAWRSQF